MILYMGDWFTVLAMFILAGEASDNSPLAIAGVLAVRSFTFAPLEPITGMLADRFPRKTLMVLANIFSFLMLTSFILLGLLDSLFSVYVLAMLLVLGRATYDPAQTAYLPRVCDDDELLTANALISGGWSASMGIGAGIAGFVISQYGVETGLMIDSVTFLVAAVVISTLPQGGPDPDEQRGGGAVEMFKDIFAGWGFILRRPEISRIVLAKGMWATGGGAQIFLLIIIGMEADFGDISTGAAGIGVLYMARGFGSGFGPIVTRPLMTVTRYMPYIIGLSLGGAGLLYVGVSQAEWGIWTLVLVFFSHGCSGISWVFSTTLLQRRTDNDWMGRVAGTDNLIIVLTMGVSTRPMSMTAAPRSRIPLQSASESPGEESRASRPMTMVLDMGSVRPVTSASSRRKSAVPCPIFQAIFSLRGLGTLPRTSYALKTLPNIVRSNRFEVWRWCLRNGKFHSSHQGSSWWW